MIYLYWQWIHPKLSLEDMGVPNKQDIVCQESTVSQPEVNLNIYETIDYLGQHCQDTLQIEKKIQTKS